MPCYQPPETSSEEESRRVSKLILILDKKLGLESDQKIINWSNKYYSNNCDIVTPILCQKIRSLNESQMESIIYDGRDKESRMLADWWDEHKKFDDEREK